MAPINITKNPKNHAGASIASGSCVAAAYGLTRYTNAGYGINIIAIESTNKVYERAFISFSTS